MNKRKYISNLLWIFLLLFTLNGCEDVLDVVPSDKVNIDRILNKNSIEGFRKNSYNNLNKTFHSFHSNQLLETYTDDAFRAGTGVTSDWHNGLLSPNEPIFADKLWEECWKGIRKSNLAIEYLPQSTAPETVVSQADLSTWIEEAKLLRAWYHFELIKNFGPMPFVEEAFDPDFVGWPDLTRPTYDEIAQRIVQELDEIIDAGILPLRRQSADEYDRMNGAVAYALKSRVLLYNASMLNNPGGDQAKWQEAVNAAQECIDAIEPEYQLLPISEYANLFSEDVTVKNNEIILRSSANGEGTMNSNNGVDLSFLGSAKQSSNCGAVPTQELVDCFELLDGTLPVNAYTNADHTNVSYGQGYSENTGDNPYAGRDARFYQSIVFNGADYGKYKGMAANADNLVIYTYLEKEGTGFNTSPTSQEEEDQRRSSTGYYSKKFRSALYWGSTTGGTNAFKIYFRLAEIYLNLAEAQCELNNLNEALSALNVVRQRAGQPNLQNVPGFSNTKEFILNRIRNERRVELCFEGHRFYDQRRWQILDETNDVVSGMMVMSSDTTDTGTFSYERVKIDVARNATSDKYLILPLPTEEARRLPGIGQPDVWK